DGPRYADGWLPVVQAAFTIDKTVYEQEAFAPVTGALADHGTVFVRFGVRGGPGTVTAQLRPEEAVTAAEGEVRDAAGRGRVLFGPGGEWDADKKDLRAALAPGRPAVLGVLTKPLAPPLPALTAERYDQERKACADAWKAL